MRRPEFLEILQPSSIKEAGEILRDRGPGGHFLAGGTDLIIAIKEKGLAPKYLVDLKRISALAIIQEQAHGGISIGALTTMRQVETSPIIRARFPFLAQSAAEIGSIQIRNRATIGGNIANATPSADLAPALLALEAKATVAGKSGQRVMDLEQFFRGPGETAMESGDILVAILVPPVPSELVGEYIKFSPREMMDLATIGVAVTLVLSEKEKRVEQVRIALGAVSPTPMRARKAESVLSGQVLTEELASQAGHEASMECKPISDVRSSADYRREMVSVNTKRALLNAAMGRKGLIPWTQRRDKRY